MIDISYKDHGTDRLQCLERVMTEHHLDNRYIRFEYISWTRKWPRIVDKHPWLASEEMMRSRLDDAVQSTFSLFMFVEEMHMAWKKYGLLCDCFPEVMGDIISRATSFNDECICWSLVHFLLRIAKHGRPNELVEADFWTTCFTLGVKLLSYCDIETRRFVVNVIRNVGIFHSYLIEYLNTREDGQSILNLIKEVDVGEDDVKEKKFMLVVAEPPWLASKK
jgi:hypothetical protein